MNKKLIIFLMIIFVLSLTSLTMADEGFVDEYQAVEEYTSNANEENSSNYQVIVEDNANLLSQDEIAKLKQDMEPLTAYGNIVFLSTNYNSTSQHNYAHDYYYPLFGEASGSVFLVDMQNRYIYIYSDGANLKVITSSKADIITDNVYRYASNGNWYGCASNAFKQMNSLLAKNAGRESKSDSENTISDIKDLILGDSSGVPMQMKYISNALIALVMAFFIAFLYVLYQSKVKMPTANEILKNCKISFSNSPTTAEFLSERRVYSPVSDSSSGSSRSSHGSGHGSHSSHSSGGGGGHRF